LEPVGYFIFLLAFLIHFIKTGKRFSLAAIVFYLFSSLIMWRSAMLALDGKQNYFLYNCFLLPAAILFFGSYFEMIMENIGRKRVVAVLFIINAALFAFRAIFLPPPHFFDSIGFATLSVSIVILSLIFFQQRLSQVSEMSIFTNFNFWVVCSYFILFSASFVVFLTYYYLTQKISANYVYKNRYMLTLLWGIPNLLLFVSSLLTLTGSLWTSYPRKS
jgi:hypothetical protein